MSTLDPVSLTMRPPDAASRHQAGRTPRQDAGPELRSPLHQRATAALPYSRPRAGGGLPSPLPSHEDLPATLETGAGTLTLRIDGIAHVCIREGYLATRADVALFLDYLDEWCPDGALLLVDKRKPYALDFSAQQALDERLSCLAAAILIPTLEKLPLAEYSRETYLRRIETRIFRSETHALRWLSTFLDHGPYLPAHDLINIPNALDLST